jgi:signal peptidase I
MKPTIMEGDMVYVNKLAYDLRVPFTSLRLARWADPKVGDVVVCFSPEDSTRLVKRVVAGPGDRIELRNEILYLNGVAQGYRAADVTPFLRDIFEDTQPLLATEALAGRNHFVMALPHRAALRSFGPLIVPEGRYFVMGDSRDNSHDSRYFGTVARSDIIGRAPRVLVSFSLSRYLLPRFDRFGLKLAGQES